MREVQVDFEARTATVSVETESFREEALTDALARAGFEGSTVKEERR